MDEEASLDDFFAKKDKNKKKSKPKIATFDSELQSHKEKHAKKQREKREKETEKQPGLTDRSSDEVKASKENEEWEDFEEEKEKDYSGLKIQTLQINQESNDEENEEEDRQSEESEKENSKSNRDLSQGPWKQNVSAAPTPVVVESEPEVKPKVEETPKTGGKYVPPSLRGGQSQSSTPSAPPLRRPVGKKSAPNISSEMDFPTLGSSGKAPAVNKDSDNLQNPNQRGNLNLTLGNKFSALQK